MITARIAFVPTLHDENQTVHVRAYQAASIKQSSVGALHRWTELLNQCQQGTIGHRCKKKTAPVDTSQKAVKLSRTSRP